MENSELLRGSWRHACCTALPPMQTPERRRLLDRLIREIIRGETQAVEHATREEKLLGLVAPVIALRDVAKHASSMGTRFETITHAHDLPASRENRISATLSSLRGLVADRVLDPERGYRTCLLDLRHGIDVVKLAREVARTEELFGIIRWCDDWLGARRTLVARVEAQLVWFVEQAGLSFGEEMPVTELELPAEEPELAGTTIALILPRHEQEEASPEHRLGVHPSRTP